MEAPIRNSVNYIAELFREDGTFDPRLSIADSAIDNRYHLYHFSIAPRITDPSNYWVIWGGYFDNPTTFGIQLFFDTFLVEVFSLADVRLLENSFFVDTINYKVYVNLPSKPPWLYAAAYSALYTNSISTFSSAPKTVNNPSDNMYGNVLVAPRLSPPSLTVRLNDALSGVTVFNSFSIVIDNADGRYDALDIRDFFNAPIQISKTSENAQTIEEFNRIRFGFVYDIKVSKDTMDIYAVDRFFLFNTEVCRKFSLAEYPNLPDSIINADIPKGWGPLFKAPVFQVNKDTADPATWIDYIVLDPGYLLAVSAVYTSNGGALTYTYDSLSGVIRVTSLDDDGKVIPAETADVTGKSGNTIGNVIIETLIDIERIPYSPGLWDTTETDYYLSICSDIGFYVSGGTTKDLIESALKNDVAFLIQKNDGRLTLRRWGENYGYAAIPEWVTTQEPVKSFQDASQYFCSSAKIQYQRNQKVGTYNVSLLDNTREVAIFEATRRSFLATFETDLLNSVDAADLAFRILDRFGTVKETLELGLGVDTFDINLLDKILYTANINDRYYSAYVSWVVKGINPGQDTLVLENIEIGDVLTFDGVDATLDAILFEISG